MYSETKRINDNKLRIKSAKKDMPSLKPMNKPLTKQDLKKEIDNLKVLVEHQQKAIHSLSISNKKRYNEIRQLKLEIQRLQEIKKEPKNTTEDEDENSVLQNTKRRQ